MRILLAKPRGFCAGVERAIETVERALDKFGAPVYVRHEIVHNKFVVDDLKRKGVIFVEKLSEIPDNAVTIFSAHGVSEDIEHEARLRNLPVIDATCPLVTKVHKEAQRSEEQGHEIILIGHEGHPEVEGTSGRVKQPVHLVQSESDVDTLNVTNPEKLSYVTQTTLSVDDTKAIISALKKRFPNIHGPDLKDICYATTNRQNAVKVMAKQVDILLVIGASNSSNSNRLRDLGNDMGIEAHLICGTEDIKYHWFDHKNTIGITAGASAPEILVERVIDYLSDLFPNVTIETMTGVEENVHFKLPVELRDTHDMKVAAK
ncbi:MAG: 4-hydroxy-3-methylbut-2-enyl diphosphate reductase [Rickettsiales bacterium]|nr:4-hydroxy-3-methylbut-2-enyl diphosphate reductase [Rickettsiales bacterium]